MPDGWSLVSIANTGASAERLAPVKSQIIETAETILKAAQPEVYAKAA